MLVVVRNLVIRDDMKKVPYNFPIPGADFSPSIIGEFHDWFQVFPVLNIKMEPL